MAISERLALVIVIPITAIGLIGIAWVGWQMFGTRRSQPPETTTPNAEFAPHHSDQQVADAAHEPTEWELAARALESGDEEFLNDFLTFWPLSRLEEIAPSYNIACCWDDVLTAHNGRISTAFLLRPQLEEDFYGVFSQDDFEWRLLGIAYDRWVNQREEEQWRDNLELAANLFVLRTLHGRELGDYMRRVEHDFEGFGISEWQMVFHQELAHLQDDPIRAFLLRWARRRIIEP